MSDFVGHSDLPFGGPDIRVRKRKPDDSLDLRVRTPRLADTLPAAERRQARQQRILQKLVEVGWAKDLTEAAFIELKRAAEQ